MTDEDLKIDRPIEGEINRPYSARVSQKGPQEFIDAIDNILAVKGIKALRFTAYTPYFNDGDPCEFGVGEIYVKLSKRFGDVESGEYYGEGRYVGSYDLYTYGDSTTNRYSDSNKTFALNGHSTREIYDAISDLDLNPFTDVIQANFGDHVQVTATTEGFSVEFYEHD